MYSNVVAWLKNEEGFSVVFESTLLNSFGVLLALIAIAGILGLVAVQYTQVERDVVGSQIEADASISRFR